MASRLETRPARRNTVAVILIDVINALDFEGSAALAGAAGQVAPRIERLAARARAARIPVIYVNDNFGQWRSDFQATVDACSAEGVPGRDVTLRLRPHDGDYFVLKPHYSGFYETPLALLLKDLGARTLILCGFATNRCVLFTANDAYLRGFRIVLPSDATASNTPAFTRGAIAHAKEALDARVVTAAQALRTARGR